MTRRYRILQLTSSSDLGGTERMLLHLARGIDRDQFEMEVGSVEGSGLLTAQAEQLGLPAWNLDRKRRGTVRAVLELHRLLRRGRFDLVQIYGLRAELMGRLLARLARIPVIVSSIRSPDPWRRPLHVFLDRFTSHPVTFWISNSEAGRQSRIRRERFPADRIITILNGIPLPSKEQADPPSPSEREAFDGAYGLAPDDGPRVAFVANLRRMKGHHDLIDALPAVLADFPRLKVLCAGRDDSDGAVVEHARKAGVEGALRFPGFVDDTLALTRQCDFSVLPSHWEGCPVSVMESMALSRAVVATEVGGIPELIRSGEDGLLIAPRSPRELAAALRKLAGDADYRHRLGQAARERAEKDFSVERMVSRIKEAYLDALTRNPRVGR